MDDGGDGESGWALGGSAKYVGTYHTYGMGWYGMVTILTHT